MIKFSLQSSRDLKDLIRRLSVGLDKLVAKVNANAASGGAASGGVPTLIGFRSVWDGPTYGVSEVVTANSYVGASNISIFMATVEYDTESAYAPDTGTYTIPSTGYYQIAVAVMPFRMSEQDRFHMYLEKNGTKVATWSQTNMADSYYTYFTCSGTSTKYFTEGDTLTLTAASFNDTNWSIQGYTDTADEPLTYWEVRKIGT